MARTPEPEEHENHERWLVSYADMITVLMAFFIVLYAMSLVDEDKYQALRTSLALGFGNESILEGNTGAMADPGTSEMLPIAPSELGSGVDKQTQKLIDTAIDQALDTKARSQQAHRMAEAAAEVQRLSDLRTRIIRALRSRGYDQDVRARIDERGLSVSLVSERVVFAAHRSDLTTRGRRIVDTIAPVLHDVPEQIEVAGHTNQIPVEPLYYDSEWELAAARAVTVLTRLSDNHDIDPRRLAALSYGEHRPLVNPNRPTAARLNKRVDIVVLSALPAETRALFTQALAQYRRTPN